MEVNEFDIIEASVRDTFGSVVWSHKIQEKQADIYSTKFIKMETAKIITATLTSVGIVSLIFSDQLWIKLVSALISFATVFINGFFKSFDLQTMVNQHKAAANSLLTVRDDLKLLLLQVRLRKDEPSVLYEKYKSTVQRLDMIYSDAPNTTKKAVMMARESLNVTQDNTFSDGEIDNFLPITLRKESDT